MRRTGSSSSSSSSIISSVHSSSQIPVEGQRQMPIAIMALSVVWNLINGYIQGFWLFHLAPKDPFYAHLYSTSWLTDPRFIIRFDYLLYRMDY